MKLAVCVKHAIDETELKLDQQGRPILQGAASKMSTFDKNAVEEAIRLRAAHQGEVVAVTVGPAEAKKTLKEALAMGADSAVLVSGVEGDSLSTAAALAAVLKKMGPFELVLCSEGASDTYSGQVPPMLAELMGLPYLGYARAISLASGRVTAERSLEYSVERAVAPLPAVLSVVSEINEPRYPTLIQIMQASKKPMVELTGPELALESRGGGVSVVSMASQQSNRKHEMVAGTPAEAASKIVAALKSEGVLST